MAKSCEGLLIEHQIGIRHRPITLYELDEAFFQALDERTQFKDALNEDGATSRQLEIDR